jgi:predicted esterase
MARVDAGEVRLKSGFLIEGTPVPVMGLTEKLIQQSRGPVPTYPILMVDAGIKRFFVGGRRVVERNRDADLSKYETFDLQHKKSAQKLAPSSLGAYTDVTPFDRFGRRTVTIRTGRGPVPIVQGITRVSPKYLTVQGLTHQWEHGIATTSLPYRVLDPIIRHVTDQDDPLDRLSIARFYLQAGMYLESDHELAAIIRDFPDYRARVQVMHKELQTLIARRLITELKLRKQAGQQRLTLARAQNFPVEKLTAEVQREVQTLIATVLESRGQQESVLVLLSELQADLTEVDQARHVAQMRQVVGDQLDPASLERLQAFLNLADAENLSVQNKLALAFSGWLLGNANAIDDLETTMRLWQASRQITEYLRSDDELQRSDLLQELDQTEGVSAERVLQMIPQLPLPLADSQVGVGVPLKIQVTPDDAEVPVSYVALLPREYSPHRSYPTVIALHPAERDAAAQLVWWGGTQQRPGQSQRHGYIVIAPNYASENKRAYDYDSRAHRIVIESLRDARKRFSIDSDRVFLAGHGMGGDAAFDIGMSHPDLFAGVVPVVGISDRYCTWYWPNCVHLPLYIVNGQLDRDSLVRNARQGQVNRMMKMGYPVIYVEYAGRGYDSYYAEIHNIFDWMGRFSRVKFPKEIDVRTLRPHDNRFYWVAAHGLPRAVLQSGVLVGDKRRKTSPMTLKARVTQGNTINLQSGAQSHTLWLSPQIVDFERRVSVRHRGKQKFNNFVKPSLQTTLEDLRIRGDRQKVYSVQLDL